MNATQAKPISLQRAARRAKVTRRTVLNWIREGLSGTKGGDRIKLKAARVGSKWLVDPADLDDFSRRLTEAALAKPEAQA